MARKRTPPEQPMVTWYFPPPPASMDPSAKLLLVGRAPVTEQAVVIDYNIQGTITDWVFQLDMTYLARAMFT